MGMEVTFRTTKIQKLCEDSTKLARKYGKIQASLIIQRINELKSADNLHDISKLPQLRLHPLKGSLKGLFSLDIQHPYRIYIEPQNGDNNELKTITEVEIDRIYFDPH